jgi:hypothetical protein
MAKELQLVLYEEVHMYIKPVTASLALTLFLMLSAGLREIRAQTMQNRILVNLPHPALVQDAILEPGRYELREVSPNLIQIFRNDVMRAEAAVQAISMEDNRPADETLIVFRAFGRDQYYVDRIWVQGRSIGYDFRVPERVKSLEREMAYALPSEPDDARLYC